MRQMLRSDTLVAGPARARRSARVARLTAVGLACAGIALGATACGEGVTHTHSAGGAGTEASGLTIGWAEPPDTLNPAVTGARDVAPIIDNVVDTLVFLTPRLKVTPDLATSWRVSRNGLTYTFRLRHGVRFQDGTPFDAASVVANVRYITDPTTRSTIAIGLLGPCTRASAPARYTVQLHCSHRFAPLLHYLGEPYMGIQSPAAIRRYGANLGNHVVGTGPFRLASYTPNQSVVLVRNPDYRWAPPALGRNGPAHLSRVTFDIVTAAQARVSELQSGQAQLIQEVPGAFYESFRHDRRIRTEAVTITGLGIWAPIDAARWPTDQLAVRRAIMYSIPRRDVVKLADAGAFPTSGAPLLAPLLGADSALAHAYPYDPAKADRILRTAGWTRPHGGWWMQHGRRLTLDLTAISTVTEYPLLAQAMQSYLRRNGMDASVSELASPAWLAANIGATMSLTPLQYVSVDPDALRLFFAPNKDYNWSHYLTPQLTRVIDAASAELDPVRRAALYRRAQRMIMNAAVFLPLHVNQDLLAMSSRLHGLAASGGGFEYLYNAHLSQ